MPPKNSGGSSKFPGGHKVIHRTAQTASVRVVTPRIYVYKLYHQCFSVEYGFFIYISGIHRSIQWSCRSGNEKTDCSRMRKKAHILRHHDWFAHETMSEKRTKKFYTDDASLTPGGTQQMFIRAGSAPRSNPLPFYISFFMKTETLSYIFSGQIVLLSHTLFRTLHPS